MEHEDQELCDCMGSLAKAFRPGNPPIKAPLRVILTAITPILLASPDPRVKALGLGLQALKVTFLGEPRKRKVGGNSR